MRLKGKMRRSLLLAGLPFLAFPFIAESGMGGDRSQRNERGNSFSDEKIVQGEIFRKDANEITLRDSNGRRISFRINNQTNQLCPGEKTSSTSQTSQSSSLSGTSNQSSSMSGSGSQSTSSMSTTSGAQDAMSGTSSESGQTTSGNQMDSQIAGFNFGDCNFQNGDFIKARIGQDGNASFVRSMGRNGENYFSAGRSGDDYFVLPAGELGGLDISDKAANYTVKTSNGEEIGHIYRVMTNSNGDMSYAIIRKQDGQMISVPWQALEGTGNKTFKLNVTKNQLGNLPILEEGGDARQHVQQHWDLTQREQQELAQWNDRLDRFYADRDRYYEDTPTFHGNREGYSRYGQRQSSVYDYDYDDRSRNERYPILGSRPGVAGERGRVSMFGSPSTLPPSEHAPQYEGADREGSSDRYSGDWRNRQSRYSDEDRNRSNRQSMDNMRSPRNRDFSNTRSQGRNSEWNYDNLRDSTDRNRQSRMSDDYSNRKSGGDSMYSQSRSRNDGGDSDGYDRYQSRRSRSGNYDYRPEPYRP